MVDIIEFDSNYVDEIVELWNKTMVIDQINMNRYLELILGDSNFDSSLNLIAIKNDKVVGYIWAVKRIYPYLNRGTEPERGFINTLFVETKHQRTGIGTKLIKAVEDKFKQRGVEEITLGAYSPNYLFPGVDMHHYAKAIKFFNQHKYKGTNKAVSMNQDLMTYSYPKEIKERKIRLEKEGYQFKSLKPEYIQNLLIFLEEQFGAGWKFNIQEALKRKEVFETVLIVLNKDDEVVGYAQRSMDGTPERFGPFGVKESLRSKGLGSIIFNEMLNDMTKKNIHSAYFLWTGGRAVNFYKRYNMRIYREYQLLRKDIK